MDLLSERHIQQADKYSMGWIRFYLSQQTVAIITFVHECVYNITCNCVCAQQYQFIPGFLLSLSPGRHRKEEVLLVQQLTTQESNQLLRFPPQNFQLKTVCISNFLSTMKTTIFEPGERLPLKSTVFSACLMCEMRSLEQSSFLSSL